MCSRSNFSGRASMQKDRNRVREKCRASIVFSPTYLGVAAAQTALELSLSAPDPCYPIVRPRNEPARQVAAPRRHAADPVVVFALGPGFGLWRGLKVFHLDDALLGEALGREELGKWHAKQLAVDEIVPCWSRGARFAWRDGWCEAASVAGRRSLYGNAPCSSRSDDSTSVSPSVVIAFGTSTCDVKQNPQSGVLSSFATKEASVSNRDAEPQHYAAILLNIYLCHQGSK